MTKSVKPIPEGMNSLTPHLVVRDGARALTFYKDAFDAQEIMRMAMPDGRLMHASMKIGNSMLMLHDEMPEFGALGPQSLKGSPVTVHLMVEDVDAVVESAVAAGAKVKMPVADMFWGDRYGKIVDPFGHEWSIATHIRDMTTEEMLAAGRQMMANASGCGPQK